MRRSALVFLALPGAVLLPACAAAADDVPPVVAALQGPPLIKVGSPAVFTSKSDQAGHAVLRLTQRVTGSRVGDRCVARTAKNRKANKCPRVVTISRLALALVAPGGMRFTFEGPIPAGRYAVTLTFAGDNGLDAVPRNRVLRVRTHPRPPERTTP